MDFKSYKETMTQASQEMPMDGNMSIADFEKMDHNLIVNICFMALEKYKKEKS
jgi:UDP-3-O-[3-hydroxymyristoyl] glucosamine N-acyltransferase